MISEDDEEDLNLILAILLKRAGGKLSFSDEELADADGERVLYDKTRDVAGFTHLYLIPDYVSIGDGDEEPTGPLKGTMTDEAMAKLLEGLKKTYTGTTTSIPPGTAVLSWDGVGTVAGGNVIHGVEFEMKMTPEDANRWKQLYERPENMYSIGWDPAGKIKEISIMADTPKPPPAPEPAPPDGGGMSTTDPTFANQSGSAPKESKPGKTSDVKKIR